MAAGQNPSNVKLIFRPQSDITAYELALLVAKLGVHASPGDITKEGYRHFECTYDPNDEESAKWVKEVFLPNRTPKRYISSRCL